MYIPGNYVLSLLTFTPMAMIPPTATPTTGSTTLNFHVGTTTPEPNPVSNGTNLVSLKGTHHKRGPLPIDLLSIDKSQEESKFLSNTTLSLTAHNTHPSSAPTYQQPFPYPLPGNLTSCPPIELIFVRGTGEPSGIGRIGTALYIELMKEYPDMTAYGIFYEASAYKGKLISGGMLDKAGKDAKERVRMWVELERERGQCKETRIVLGGFSLGAAVLQKTKLSLEEQERVDAVVIFGYPWKLRPHKCAQYPLEAEKVWTKCIPQDPVCDVESIFTDGTFFAHRGYVEYVGEAVEFIRRKVQN